VRKLSLVNQDEQAGGPTRNLLLSLLLPAYDRLSQQAWRTKTHEAAMITTLAILRYKSQKDQYPGHLDELVSEGFLRKLPPDPYGPGPLSYDRTPEGFLLYSWGENLRDDGGRQGVGQDGQARLWRDNGDWVFWPVPRKSDEPDE
jgi:hypothetical protein